MTRRRRTAKKMREGYWVEVQNPPAPVDLHGMSDVEMRVLRAERSLRGMPELSELLGKLIILHVPEMPSQRHIDRWKMVRMLREKEGLTDKKARERISAEHPGEPGMSMSSLRESYQMCEGSLLDELRLSPRRRRSPARKK
jgi:hypothetical protein